MCQAVEGIRQMYINKGMEEGICTLVTTCQELGASYDYVIGKLKEKYCLNDTEIQDLYENVLGLIRT